VPGSAQSFLIVLGDHFDKLSTSFAGLAVPNSCRTLIW
jgi:hypothetical protein